MSYTNSRQFFYRKQTFFCWNLYLVKYQFEDSLEHWLIYTFSVYLKTNRVSSTGPLNVFLLKPLPGELSVWRFMGTLVDLYIFCLSEDTWSVFGLEPDIFLLKLDQLVVMAGLFVKLVVLEALEAEAARI